FLFHAPPPPSISTLSLHDALPIFGRGVHRIPQLGVVGAGSKGYRGAGYAELVELARQAHGVRAVAGPYLADPAYGEDDVVVGDEIGRAPSELQSRSDLVCRLLLEK